MKMITVKTGSNSQNQPSCWKADFSGRMKMSLKIC